MIPAARLGLLACLAANLPAAEFNARLAHAKGGDPLIEATVSLIPLDQPAPPLPADAQSEIAQEGQEFDGFITIVQAGTKVVFPNRDTVQHHIYSLSKPKRFEKPLYASGASESVLFDQPGVVALGCNIHDWMIAYVVVLPTPWFAKTGAEGSAQLAGAPPGRYRLEVWHPRLPRPVLREVTLGAGDPAAETVALTLKADRRIRRAPETRTGAY